MNTQAHTSGPWGVSRHAAPESFPQFGVYAESGNGRDLAHVVSHGTATSAETESNARLIAAAPDLLQSLKALADHVFRLESKENVCSSAWMDAREAIERAEGRAGE